MSEQRWELRWGLLCELVTHAVPAKLGRTAIMKIAYFLQTFKDVPLDYDFRLYIYGPFDSDVLSDLGQLESLGAVKSHLVMYPSGYGYKFTPGPNLDEVQALIDNPQVAYRDAIDWAMKEFGHRNAAELELISTIVYAGREAVKQRQPIAFDELCRQVKAIKPHFDDSDILQHIRDLAFKGLFLEEILAQGWSHSSVPATG